MLRRWKRWAKKRWLICLFIATPSFWLAFVVLEHFELAGRVHGVEFSPDLVKHRSFSYWVLFDVQVTPTRQHEWFQTVDEFLHSNGYVAPSSQTPPRWYFVKGFRPSWRGWIGPAKSYCQAVGCWGSGSDWQTEFTKKHPELAARLWPRVLDLARREEFDTVRMFLGEIDFQTLQTTDELDAAFESAWQKCHPESSGLTAK